MIAAIVPAAGRSRRMGSPKLLLKVEGRPILAGVIDALRQGGAGLVVAVVPPASEPEGPRLAEIAAGAGARVVAPATRPSEMRHSIELGLAEAARLAPPVPDAVLIAPADSPGITADLVDSLIRRYRESPDSVIIPSFQGVRGHPIAVPWKTALRIPGLPPDLGVNALVADETREGRVIELELDDSDIIADLDTPEDAARWRIRLERDEASIPNRHQIKIRLFALARQRAGKSEIAVEIAPGGTVAELKAAIAETYPPLADLLPNVLIAVDSDYAGDRDVIPAGANVAIIPPVSGGCGILPGGTL